MTQKKLLHFLAAFAVYFISMVAVNYLWRNEPQWISALIFGVFLGIADVLFLKKWRDRNTKK